MRSFRTFYPSNKRIQIISLMLASSLAVAKTSQISPVKKKQKSKETMYRNDWNFNSFENIHFLSSVK